MTNPPTVRGTRGGWWHLLRFGVIVKPAVEAVATVILRSLAVAQSQEATNAMDFGGAG